MMTIRHQNNAKGRVFPGVPEDGQGQLAFLFKKGRKDRWQNNDLQPADFFYGLLDLPEDLSGWFLEQEDFNLSAGMQRSRMLDRLGFALGLNLPFCRALNTPENLQKLNSFSVLFATTNAWGLALSYLKYKRKLTASVIFLSMGALEKRSGPLQRWFFRMITSSVQLATLSRAESTFLGKVTGKDVAYLPFAVDTAFWYEDPAPTEHPWFQEQASFFFAIGNDRHRDFETLVRAWESDFPELRIVTKIAIQEKLPANVKLLSSDLYEKQITDEDLRRIYSRALGVIVPLKQTIQPSGQSVALQSIACSTPVIMARNEGFWDEDLLECGVDIRFYDPGDAAGLTKRVGELLAETGSTRRSCPSGADGLSKEFSLSRYGQSIGNLVKALLEKERNK